MVTDHSK